MLFRTQFGLSVALSLAFLLPTHVVAQDDDVPQKHGRKYKAPPDTSHIEVEVVKGFNKKPIPNAAVIFHPVKNGVDEGNLEVKTNPDGKAIIDVIPTGSSVRIQVLANGFATFAEDYTINEPTREIHIAMQRPQAQVSTYTDNSGKVAPLNPGVQEPVRPAKKPATNAPAVSPAAQPAPAAAQPAAPAAAPGSQPQQ